MPADKLDGYQTSWRDKQEMLGVIDRCGSQRLVVLSRCSATTLYSVGSATSKRCINEEIVRLNFRPLASA